MKRKPEAGQHGRVYHTNGAFKLTALERVKALFGGEVHISVRIAAIAGASSLPTEIRKGVNRPQWARWPR